MRSTLSRRQGAPSRLITAGAVLLTLTVFPVAASAAPRAASTPGAVAPVRGGLPQPPPVAHTESPTPAQGRHPRELDHGPQRDQAEEAQPDGNLAMAAAKARGHRVVVDDRSTVAATTYANPDGSMTRTTVPPGVFHLDHGSRVRTDLSVLASSDATYPLQVPGAARPLHLGRGAAHLLAWDLPGGTVTATSDPGETSGGPTADSSGAVSWPGSPHRSLRVVPTLTGFDGQLVLQDAEAASTFTVTLHDPQHVLAGAGAATKTGGWSIPGADGTSAFVLDAPHAYETTVVTGKALPRSTTARLTVTHHGDDYDVTTTVDPQWLSTARFPVVIDPRTHFDTGEWGYTNAGPVPDCPVTDANGGNAGNCFQGHDLDYVADGTYGNYRIQIRPDLSGIPANAQVLSATLWMNATATAPYAQQLLLLCNSTGYYGEVSGDTWNNTGGGHLGGTCTSTWSSGSGWQSFDFTGNAQTYVNGGTNSGLVLRENCEYSNCTEYTHFTSGWDGGYGSPWPQASITWAAPPQTTPSPASIAAGDSSLTTAWNYPSDDGGNPVLSYNVYTTDTTTNQLIGGTYQNVAAGTYSKSYAASDGITNGHNYYSFILACNDHGCGPGVATATVTAAPLPTAATLVFADPGLGDGQASVQWQAATSATVPLSGYIVTATSTSGTLVSVSVGPTATSAVIGGLTDGTDYTVTVTAKNSSGSGPAATAAYIVTAAGLPTQVASVTAVAEDGGAIVSFPAATAVGAAVVDYDVTASPGGASVQTSGNTTTAFSGLTDGVSYTFTVTAHDVIGDSGVSVASNIVTPSPGLGNAQVAVETSYAVNTAASSGQRVEIPSLEAGASTTFANPDGSLTTDLTATPTRQFVNGQWLTIDPTLHVDASDVRPAELPVDLSLGAGGDTRIATLAPTANTSLQFSWSSTLPQPSLQDSTATYTGVATSTDLLVTAQQDGFDEALRLSGPSAGAPSYRLHINTTGGVTITSGIDGSLTFTDGSGNVVGTAAAPTLFDSQVSPTTGDPSNTGSVFTVLTGNAGSGYDLVLTPSPTFLAAASTQYPVTLDPATVKLVADTFVQSNITSSEAGEKQLKSGTYDSGTDKARSLLKFDVSSYAGESITAATLKLFNTHSWTCTALPTDIYQITADWSPSSATFTHQPAVAGSATASATFAYGDSCGGGQYASFDVKNLVAAWVSGTANYGLEVRGRSETDSTYWKKYSSSEDTSSRVPVLQVNTAAPPQKAPPPQSPPPPSQPAPPGSQPAPNSGQQTGKLWGADNTANADTKYAGPNYPGESSSDTFYDGVNKRYGAAQVFGQYLGTLTNRDASYLHDKSRGARVLVISNLGVGTRTENSCANGVRDADATVDSAIQTKVPANTVLFYDSEAPMPTPSNTASYVNDAWIKCYEDEVRSYSASKKTSYRPGFYGAPYSSAQFQSAYCSAVKADKKYIAVMYVTDARTSGKADKASSPGKFAPTPYNCQSMSYAWQYLLQSNSGAIPPIDDDEYQGPANVLW